MTANDQDPKERSCYWTSLESPKGWTMTESELKKALGDEKCVAILRCLFKTPGGAHFNELCRKLKSEVSRNTLFDRLVWMEDAGIVESEMRRLDLAEFDTKTRVRRWIKHYGLPRDTKVVLDSLWRTRRGTKRV